MVAFDKNLLATIVVTLVPPSVSGILLVSPSMAAALKEFSPGSDTLLVGVAWLTLGSTYFHYMPGIWKKLAVFCAFHLTLSATILFYFCLASAEYNAAKIFSDPPASLIRADAEK